MQLAEAGDPRDERIGRGVAADPPRLLEQPVGLAGERRNDGDDLLAVADVTVDFLHHLHVVVLVLDDRAPELQHAEPFGRYSAESCSCFFNRA